MILKVIKETKRGYEFLIPQKAIKKFKKKTGKEPKGISFNLEDIEVLE